MSFAGTTLGLAGGDLVSLSPTGDLVEAPVVRLDFSNIASIEESSLVSNNVVLYPNPTSNEATIAFTLNNDAAVTIEVRDLSGKVVYTSNEGQLVAGAHNTTLSTESMASGMYTYSVSANGAVVTNKFVVKK
jgi:flagellar hook assembly protein FlgD